MIVTKSQNELNNAKPSFWSSIKSFFFKKPMLEIPKPQKLSAKETDLRFLKRIRSEYPEVRRNAVLGIARKGRSIEAIPSILTLLHLEEEPSVREACVFALGVFVENGNLDAENKSFLRDVIKQKFMEEYDKKAKKKMEAVLKKLGISTDNIAGSYPHWIGEKIL